MERFKFGTCEFSFPCWGALAMKMAHEAGFTGMQLSDAGGYLQPHPQNNGYVEYERYGLDLRRKDAFPLTSRCVQEDYLEAASTYQMELVSIYLYTLEHQGFLKYSRKTPQGEQCLESIRNGVLAAAQMGIPSVTIAAKGMFGAAQNQYAFEMLQYAAEIAEDYGVRIAVSTDLPPSAQLRLTDAIAGKLALAFDTVAPLVYGTGAPAQLIRELGGNRIDHFRMRDCHLDSEGFPDPSAVALLGRGETHFAEAARTIRHIGYSGWIISDTPYYHPKLHCAGEDYVSLAKKEALALCAAFQEQREPKFLEDE